MAQNDKQQVKICLRQAQTLRLNSLKDVSSCTDFKREALERLILLALWCRQYVAKGRFSSDENEVLKNLIGLTMLGIQIEKLGNNEFFNE